MVAQLLADAPTAQAAGDAVGVNDPDVTGSRVSVDVRLPAHDRVPAGSPDSHYRELYATEIPFRAFDPADVLYPGPPVTLTLDYVDQADIAALVPPPPGVAALPVPGARDLRLRLAPVWPTSPTTSGAPRFGRG